MLTDGMLASSLLRPASSSARRWVAENIDALDRDDATAILRLSALDARDIEQALEQCLPRIRMGNAERISDYEHGWLRHIAADMKVSILRSLVAPMGKPKISAMLDDLVLRLATGNVAEIVKNLLAGDPTV